MCGFTIYLPDQEDREKYAECLDNIDSFVKPSLTSLALMAVKVILKSGDYDLQDELLALDLSPSVRNLLAMGSEEDQDLRYGYELYREQFIPDRHDYLSLRQAFLNGDHLY